MRKTPPSLLFFFILLIPGSFALWLTSSLPVSADSYRVDDSLFVALAENFASWLKGTGSLWLGPYTSLTFAKGPFYPVWLGFVDVSGIPVHTADMLLYLFAGFVLISALGKGLRQKYWLLLIFFLYAFNPLSYTPSLRLFRSSLYPALIVLTLACFTGLFTFRKEALWKLGIWAFAAGLSLGAFWLTREEGLWILPALFVLGASCLFSFRSAPLTADTLKRVLTCVLLPWAFFFLFLAGVTRANFVSYGTPVLTDTTRGTFPKAYGALTRVKHSGDTPRQAPVPQETLEKIYAVSPAAAELKSTLESDTWQLLDLNFPRPGREKRDLSAAFLQWAVRDAANKAGYYQTPQTADAYYSRLAGEINRACDSRQLDCLPPRETMFPVLTPADTLPFFQAFLKGLEHAVYLNVPEYFSQQRFSFQRFSVLSPEIVSMAEKFQRVSNSRLSPLKPSLEKIFEDTSSLTVQGWAFLHPDHSPLQLKVMRGVQEQKSVSSREPSEEAAEAYQDPNLSRVGFTLRVWNCESGCVLVFTSNDQPVASVDLDSGKTLSSSFGVRFRIDGIHKTSFLKKARDIFSAKPPSFREKLKLQSLRAIGKVYRSVLPPLVCAAFLFYIVLIVRAFIKKQISCSLLLASALLLSFFCYLGLLALVQVTSFPVLGVDYEMPLFALLLLLTGVILTAVSEEGLLGTLRRPSPK